MHKGALTRSTLCVRMRPILPPPLRKYSSRGLHLSGENIIFSPFKGPIYANSSPDQQNAFSSTRLLVLVCKKAVLLSPLWLHTRFCLHLAGSHLLKVQVRPQVMVLPFFASSRGVSIVLPLSLPEQPSQMSFQSPRQAPGGDT